MKKQALLFLLLTPGLLIVAISVVSAQSDLTAYSGKPIADSQIDGILGSEWNDTGKYNATINPSGRADVWTKNDGTYFYLAIRFTADSNNPWVAVQLGASFCMSTNADGALFGHDEFSPNGYVDISFGEPAKVISDAIQNGVGAISVSSSNVTVVELKKPLNSGDTAGKDLAWSSGNTYAMVMIWNTNGLGSSGGSTTHFQGTATPRTMLISSSRMSGFPVLPVALSVGAAAVLLAVSAVILKRRNARKQTQNLKA